MPRENYGDDDGYVPLSDDDLPPAVYVPLLTPGA